MASMEPAEVLDPAEVAWEEYDKLKTWVHLPRQFYVIKLKQYISDHNARYRSRIGEYDYLCTPYRQHRVLARLVQMYSRRLNK